jgi:hypothetical protein
MSCTCSRTSDTSWSGSAVTSWNNTSPSWTHSRERAHRGGATIFPDPSQKLQSPQMAQAS